MSDASHQLSLLNLVLHADPIVKAVLALLVAASIGCWAVILEKSVRFAGLRRKVSRFEAGVLAGDPAPGGPASEGDVPGAILAAAMREWRAGKTDAPSESRAELRDRLERAMRATLGTELRRLETKLPFLATTGSAAPFIGLFGTVWGIMNSFSAIAQSNDTSLAVVAPGIAEALFATAIGLVAAIPAVIAYNKLTTDLGRIAHRLHAAIGELGSQLPRRLVASDAKAAG